MCNFITESVKIRSVTLDYKSLFDYSRTLLFVSLSLYVLMAGLSADVGKTKLNCNLCDKTNWKLWASNLYMHSNYYPPQSV